MKRLCHKTRILLLLAGLISCIIIGLIGPAATALQMRAQIPHNANDIDIIYLVCGARAQARRLAAMEQWLQQHDTRHITIWIGNDAGNSLWSRQQQRNLTRAEWAHKHTSHFFPDDQIKIIPGTFSNTDGEMKALAEALAQQPKVDSIAFVTCGFHARRTLARFAAYAPAAIRTNVIPVTPYWENRAPWIVAAEWLKILRDQFRLSQHPWFSRQP